jgi:hypothetical protein
MLRLGLAPGSRLRVWRPPPALQAGEGAWLVGEVVATCTQVKERGKDPQLYHTVRCVLRLGCARLGGACIAACRRRAMPPRVPFARLWGGAWGGGDLRRRQ